MTSRVSQEQLSAITACVEQAVFNTPVYDIHTHLYDPAFGSLLLWGIDELLVYHYLVSEAFRHLEMPHATFWALSQTERADWVWRSLFIEHSPISEACRGVLTTLQALGLDVKRRDLPALRRWFAAWKVEDYLDHCLRLAKVRKVCMTNSPFDDAERICWDRGLRRDERFRAGLRLDPLLVAWPESAARLVQWGYQVRLDGTGSTWDEVRRFLADWTVRIRPEYLMASLPPTFEFPSESIGSQVLRQAILPHGREHGLPLALMVGVKRGMNPALGLAADGAGLSRMESVEALCAEYPANKFLVTALVRENQHQLCIIARKFRNLHPFGCWWFTNIPLLMGEITRLRLELVGLSMTPQHSDARVLDQVVYKWAHFREVLAPILTEKYLALAATGWEPTPAEIERDVHDLFGGAFERFCQRQPA